MDTKRYNELLKKERMLEALWAGGVDNWVGYDDSLAEVRKEDVLEDKISEFVERDMQENYLVDYVNVDWPAGMDAGVSVTLTEEGEVAMVGHLMKLFKEIQEETE